MPGRSEPLDAWTSLKSAVKAVPVLSHAARWVARQLRLEQRAEARLLRERPHQLYQPGGRTALDRYPELFAALRGSLEGMPQPRILSYGCSTGEEILTLRSYIPSARLAGIEINAHRLNQARRKVRDREVQFWVAGSIDEADAGMFDAITCLSVLHRRETLHNWPADPTPHMSFATFERAVLDLDRHLRPGGILLLDHMSFRFSDTSLAPGYTALPASSPDGAPLKRYDRNNQPVLVPAREHASLWRKKP